jgi:hypothetical protein
MPKSQAVFLGVIAMCGICLILVALMHAPNNSAPVSGVVVSIPIVTEDNGAEELTMEKEFECPDEGTYWVQVRYSRSLQEIDANIPRPGRKFGSAVVTAFNLTPKVSVKESESNTELTPKEVKWRPTETSSKASKYAADRFELRLRANTRYRLRFTVIQPSTTWIELKPTLVVEASHAIRINKAFKFTDNSGTK